MATLGATIVIGLVTGCEFAPRQSKQAASNSKIELAKPMKQVSRQLARHSPYVNLLESARDLIAKRPGQWRADAIQQLDEASGLHNETVESDQQLRSLLATCLVSTDMRPVARWNTDFTPYCLAFSDDGQFLAVGADHFVNHTPVAVWSFRHSRPVDQLDMVELEGVRCLMFDREDTMVLAGTRQGEVVAWDLRQPDADVTWRILAHESSVLGMAISPSRKSLYTSSNDREAEHNSIRRWSLGDGVPTLAGEYKHTGQLGEFVLSTDGRLLACVVERGPLLLLDTVSLQLDERWQAIDKPPRGDCVSLSRDMRMLALGDRYGNVETWDIEVGTRTSTIFRDSPSDTAHDDGIRDLEFDPTGQLLATTGGGDVKLWEVTSGRLLASDTIGGAGPMYARFSPMGDRLAVTGNLGVSMYAIERSEFASSVAMGADSVEAIDFAASVPTLVSLRGQRERYQQQIAVTTDTIQASQPSAT